MVGTVVVCFGCILIILSVVFFVLLGGGVCSFVGFFVWLGFLEWMIFCGFGCVGYDLLFVI